MTKRLQNVRLSLTFFFVPVSIGATVNLLQTFGFSAYICVINSFSLKDCFYTETLRDRLTDAPATIRNREHGANS